MVPTRRKTLATIGLALSVAGCSGFGDPDLVIENELDQSVTASVDITRMSDMQVIVQKDRSIESGGTTDFLNPFDKSAEYRIQITTDEANAGGEQTAEQADDDPIKLRASINSNGVTFADTS
jgi:hypothetical protein